MDEQGFFMPGRPQPVVLPGIAKSRMGLPLGVYLEPYRDIISKLYIEENRTLQELREVFEREYGISISYVILEVPHPPCLRPAGDEHIT